MVFLYLLATIGLLVLLGLAAAAVFGAGRSLDDRQPEDAFDLALSAVSRLQGAAWRAVNELRELDSRKKE